MPRHGAGKATEGGRTCQPVSGSGHDTKAATGHASPDKRHSQPDITTKQDLRRVAVAALLAVASDATSPAAARAQAARTLLELDGALGPGRVPDTGKRPVSEMTLADIDAEISALEASSAAK